MNGSEVSWLTNSWGPYYTINNMVNFNELEVEFDAIPPTYTLSITATGNGYATYDGTTIRNTTKDFSVEEGASATITLVPDAGYQIKSLSVNGANRTSSLVNNQYTISNIHQNTTVAVEFEAIPPPSYTLSITATEGGYATYNGKRVGDGDSESFSVQEGTAVAVTFTYYDGYHIKNVTKNNTDVTTMLEGNQLIFDMTGDVAISVAFEENLEAIDYQGLHYTVVSYYDGTLLLSGGKYDDVIEVPAGFSYNGKTWSVVGVEGSLDTSGLTAVIWHPETLFNATVDNPNMLLYVADRAYALYETNVVVNGTADRIVLTDADSGNNFHCPQAFKARSISYTHEYSMTTGIDEARGWETIVLPFDVQTITHETKGELTPFREWRSGDAEKPFWLMRFGSSGWTSASSLEANRPYIISMPNNSGYYLEDYNLYGWVTFSATDATVYETSHLESSTYQGKTFIPTYTEVGMGDGAYALNVVNDIANVTGGYEEGSRFLLNARSVHPFEAYMHQGSSTRGTLAIAISDDMHAAADDTPGPSLRIYNLKGQLLRSADNETDADQWKKSLPAGVYIINRQKILVK